MSSKELLEEQLTPTGGPSFVESVEDLGYSRGMGPTGICVLAAVTRKAFSNIVTYNLAKSVQQPKNREIREITNYGAANRNGTAKLDQGAPG